MKKIFLLFVLVLFLTAPAGAEGETMQKLYIVPIETVEYARGPEYFVWRFDANPPSVDCRWSFMDYGFINHGLLVAHDITQADHDALILHSDVYAFPDNLDQPVNEAGLDAFFEPMNIPTDWLTPSTTYRQFLRYTAGMFQFNQRYGGIAANETGQPGYSVFSNGRTLESNWNSLSAQEKRWFNATIQSFGYPQTVQGNPKFRTLAKQAGDLWGTKPFIMGGFEF